eukprot:s643_g12.t1
MPFHVQRGIFHREGNPAAWAMWEPPQRGHSDTPRPSLIFTDCGFGSMSAQLEEDFISAFVVRIMAWYPYYAISLIFLASYFFSYSAWDWSSFTAQFFLISGAFETRKVTFPYLPCSWWFSLLAVYTLGWYPMHTVLKGSLNSVIWTMFTVATTVVIPSVLLEYLFLSEEPLFQMIQYSPSYFFGQALAIWQVKHCMLMQVQTGQSGSPSTQLLTLQCVPQTDRLEFERGKGCHTRLTKAEVCNLESREAMDMALAVIGTTCYYVSWSSIRDGIPCASASV